MLLVPPLGPDPTPSALSVGQAVETCVEASGPQLSRELNLPAAGLIQRDVGQPTNVGGQRDVALVENSDPLAAELAEEEPKFEDDVLASPKLDGAVSDRVRFVIAGQDHDGVLRAGGALLELLDDPDGESAYEERLAGLPARLTLTRLRDAFVWVGSVLEPWSLREPVEHREDAPG